MWAHAQTRLLSHFHSPTLLPSLSSSSSTNPTLQPRSLHFLPSPRTHLTYSMTSSSTPMMPKLSASRADIIPSQSYWSDADMKIFADVANLLADAAGEVIRGYFRKKFDILDKDDLSPVTIADRMAEEAMIAIIIKHFPSHAIFGEENGWRCKEQHSDYVWVLDPIDGTKSFITGKPLFGTLIALLYKGKPILGVIDQPILRERWIGMLGRKTTLNGEEVSTRSCTGLSQAYMYTTSPHLFAGASEEAFIRLRNKVKVPLYGCDCYAYALLASGFVDLVVESGLKPYDFLALIPVIEGAGGSVTDWKGEELFWEASPESYATGFNVVAAGDAKLHQEAVSSLEWI